jgi:hypothetical protein
MAADFTYLYGFTPREVTSPSNLAGIAGSAVRIVSVGPVSAVISDVPADVYDPANIDERLKDLAWVAQQGVAHETVVAWFVDNAQILPVSLFTMYSSVQALQDAVFPRSPELASELKRLSNKREWDIKISFDEKKLQQHAGKLSPRIALLDKAIAESTPGKRYLLEKKRADLLKDEVLGAAHVMANEALDYARSDAELTRILPIPRTTEILPVILHAALLIDRRVESKLAETLERERSRLERHGLTLQYSGPWAPYRFTGDDDRAVAESE